MMIDPIFGINTTNAGLFSAAAYDPIQAAGPTETLLHGWIEDVAASREDATDRVRVFVNSITDEVVLAFKGTDNWTNLKSDLVDSGASEYSNFHDDISAAFNQAKADYAGYHFYVDGHSLGGGMAQNFALEKGIDGFGQNSLPATNGTDASIAAYLTQNTFIETNVAGDIATLYYAKLGNGKYLDPHATELPSIYPAIEFLGMGVAVGTSGFGAAAAAWAFYHAHHIDTVNSLTERYELAADGHLDVPSQNTTLPTSDAIWFLQAAAKAQSIHDNGDGTLSIQDWLQQDWTVGANVSGDGDVQAVTLTVTGDWHDAGCPSTDHGTVNAFLTNSDKTNPIYSVSWSPYVTQSMIDFGSFGFSGTYTYSANGSFSGSAKEIVDSSTYEMPFSFDPDVGTITGPALISDYLANNVHTLFSDGTYQVQLVDGSASGSFMLSSNGTATWYFQEQSTSESKTDTNIAFVDGSYEEQYYSNQWGGYTYMQYADGNSDYTRYYV
jgi:hypothetical protein